MKREEVKAIFPEVTEEQMKAILDLNTGDIEKVAGVEPYWFSPYLPLHYCVIRLHRTFGYALVVCLVLLRKLR